jgi:hypothetical protein
MFMNVTTHDDSRIEIDLALQALLSEVANLEQLTQGLSLTDYHLLAQFCGRVNNIISMKS